jgi:hypothetical protein
LRFAGLIANDGSAPVRYIRRRATKGKDDVFGGERETLGQPLLQNFGLRLRRNMPRALPRHDLAGVSPSARAMGRMPPNRVKIEQSCSMDSFVQNSNTKSKL